MSREEPTGASTVLGVGVRRRARVGAPPPGNLHPSGRCRQRAGHKVMTEAQGDGRRWKLSQGLV